MGDPEAPRVVVGVDDSLAGLQALRYAATEARRRGAVLRAVRAWQLSPSWYGVDFGRYRADLVTEAAETILTAFREAMGGVPTDLTVEAIAVEGQPDRVLTDQARGDDDLLVVGRGRRRLLRPSTVDTQCVRSARGPVVVVAAPSLARVRGAAELTRDVVRAAESLLHGAAPPRP
jgi:nucleotide-binding universal stress UspA family protein